MGWKGENNFSSNVLVAPLKEDNVQQQKALLKLDCQLNLAFMVIFQISVNNRLGRNYERVYVNCWNEKIKWLHCHKNDRSYGSINLFHCKHYSN